MRNDQVVLHENLEDKRSSLEEIIFDNRWSVVGVLFSLILVGIGVFLYKQGFFDSSDKVEILNPQASVSPTNEKEIVVEVSGAVEKPGVYKLPEGSRIEDLIIAAGGISVNADRDWMEKYLNRASKINDGQKLYIAREGEQLDKSSANSSQSIKVDQGVLGVNETGLTNINTASLQELDSLPGIGQVYGQSIIDHRPYLDVPELVSKGALKQGVYDKIKDLVAVY